MTQEPSGSVHVQVEETAHSSAVKERPDTKQHAKNGSRRKRGRRSLAALARRWRSWEQQQQLVEEDAAREQEEKGKEEVEEAKEDKCEEASSEPEQPQEERGADTLLNVVQDERLTVWHFNARG